jgi:protein-S-isoprenylcysteine O-methyltransferase Ste14
MMEKKRYESRLFFVMLYLIMILAVVASSIDPTGVTAGRSSGSLSDINLILMGVGLGIILLGLTTRIVAIATLKKNFSTRLRIREGHTLVTNGIYHWIRHPAYLGLILIVLGIPVLLSSVLGFLAMILVVPLLLHRIKLEEAMLLGQFGAMYEEYMGQTKRLIPFLY